METLRLYASVPVACFRVAQAREYWETYPCPPPSTVYGMLLSLVGETDRTRHVGAQIAVGLRSEPAISVVLRTLWRVKDRKEPPGVGSNARPDFQELLTDVQLALAVRTSSRDAASDPLLERLTRAFDSPASVSRFGGLSLGESTFLVDDIRRQTENDPTVRQWLVQDDRGDLSLPIWADHVGSRNTRWGQFRLNEAHDDAPPDESWVTIQPPDGGT